MRGSSEKLAQKMSYHVVPRRQAGSKIAFVGPSASGRPSPQDSRRQTTLTRSGQWQLFVLLLLGQGHTEDLGREGLAVRMLWVPGAPPGQGTGTQVRSPGLARTPDGFREGLICQRPLHSLLLLLKETPGAAELGPSHCVWAPGQAYLFISLWTSSVHS